VLGTQNRSVSYTTIPLDGRMIVMNRDFVKTFSEYFSYFAKILSPVVINIVDNTADRLSDDIVVPGW
jgi:hypothetical protein